jgi:two-component system sensor histidine kinase UhpB
MDTLSRTSLESKPGELAGSLRAFVDASIHWEYLVEPDGRLGYISPACEAITGYPPHAFESDPALLESLVHPDDRAIVGSHLREEDITAPERMLEFRIVTRTGDVRWILHHCRPLGGRDERLLGRRAMIRDVTARKNVEQEQARVENRLKHLTQQLITVQEAERARIAQDLHDDIGQAMTALLLRLTAIGAGLTPEQQEIRDQMQEAVESVESLMNQVRQLAHQLRPPPLDSMPLSKALESLCTSYGQYASFRIDYSSDLDLPPIPNLQATALYRLAQEGLTNAVKYAQSNSVWINLDFADGEVSLSVEDDGRGFDLKRIGDGMGLRGLQERFRLLNGGLEIESAPGAGTRVSGYLPLAIHGL